MNNNIWYDTKVTRTGRPPVKHWDVRITLNKCGHENRYVFRFGFLNKAAEVFGAKPFIEVSSVKKLPKRIYFKLHDEKVNRNAHKLCTNSHSSTSNLYTSITPVEGEEKIYRMNWINNTYSLKFDEEAGYYYIENETI